MLMDSIISISIHAPTRGATLWHWLCLIILLFQSTLPREERLHQVHLKDCCQTFQSTLPREERLQINVIIFTNKVFQSTLPREERLYHIKPKDNRKISIHAPTRGATHLTKWDLNSLSISIHAPTRGATCTFRQCS